MENIKQSKPIKPIIFDFIALFCDVILFSSAVNCLFQSLAYAKAFDIVLFIVSLVLGFIVYYLSLNPKRNPKVEKRLAIAVGAVIIWAILIPVLYLQLH